MALGSLIAGIAALLLMMGGMFLTIVPFAGTILSFLAPVVAIAGIVMGGLALSRAKRDGEPTGLATGGLIVNIVMLIPTLLVAVTCGLCNACFTAGSMAPRRDGGDSFAYDYDFQAGYEDAGMGTLGTSPAPTAPNALAGPPTEAELAAEVEVLNELCGDTFCEGEFDYRFQSLSCETDHCTLKFTAKHYDSPEDAPYEEHSVEVAVTGEVMECNRWEHRGGDEVCTGRGLTQPVAQALGDALTRWERDHVPAR